ncbi:MAG: 30S ribosome-binding factor RbfA [Tepidisphaeraceae bacterium]
MIGSTLQQELMQIIMRQLNDPRLEGMPPSITRVKVATDLSTADVYVTIMGSEGKQNAALHALRSSASMMREKLRKSLPMRTIPMLKFHIDEALKKELTVLELIDKAVKEENELHPETAQVEDDNQQSAEASHEERDQARRESQEPDQEADQGGPPRAQAAD